MDLALEDLGVKPSDQKRRKDTIEKISRAVELFRVHRENEPSAVIDDDRERLVRLQEGISRALGALRNSDPTFLWRIFDSTEDGQQAIACFEDLERRIQTAKAQLPTKKQGRPKIEADRYFVAALHDLFEEFRPDEASGYDDGPLNAFVEHVFEMATSKNRDRLHLIKEVRRIIKADPD